MHVSNESDSKIVIDVTGFVLHKTNVYTCINWSVKYSILIHVGASIW